MIRSEKIKRQILECDPLKSMQDAYSCGLPIYTAEFSENPPLRVPLGCGKIVPVINKISSVDYFISRRSVWTIIIVCRAITKDNKIIAYVDCDNNIRILKEYKNNKVFKRFLKKLVLFSGRTRQKKIYMKSLFFKLDKRTMNFIPQSFEKVREMKEMASNIKIVLPQA